MMSFFGTAAGRALNNNHTLTQPKALDISRDSPTHLDYSNQTTIPQQMDTNNKLKFNDKTQKSLFKLNLFIKRLNSNFFSQRKSSKELYREAAKLLGIACSLTDNCRCIECQSRYFDCDDEYDMDDSDSDGDDSDSDTDSCSSDITEKHDHIVTNCYLIHTEQLCECCNRYQIDEQQQQFDNRDDATIMSPAFTDMGFNEFNFNGFVS
ncbi:unnamed protein product [Diamesa tonsa]